MTRLQKPCLGANGRRCNAITRDPSSRCDTCRSAWNRARGTTTERGYGGPHKELREQWATRINSGELVICAHPDCGKQILPGQEWDLGHNPDRTHSGPEHRACTSTRNAQGTSTRTSTDH